MVQYVFSSTKSENRFCPEGSKQGEGGPNNMSKFLHLHMSKCKNDQIKFLKKEK
jgi:hypothetical protein